MSRHIPDDEVIHASVIVDETVTHPSHFAPFESGQICAGVLRHFLRSLSDDFETANGGAFEHFVGEKAVAVNLCDVSPQEFCFAQDVAKQFNRGRAGSA